MASATTTQNKYYRLASNIDFTGQKYYPLGTNANKFGGTLIGDYHTISGITTGGYDNVGVIGYNTGTISDIKFNNITITGSSNNVGIVANSTGTLRGIIVRNTSVTGYDNTGILVGNNLGGTSSGSNIKTVDVQGTVNGNEHVGGVVGNGGVHTRITDFVFKGNVTGRYWVSGVIGYSETSNNTAVGLVYDTTITADNTNMGTITTWNMSNKNVLVLNTTMNMQGSGHNGTTITDRTLEAVNSVIDTTIGGDNDSDGYYFTLNNGNFELIPSN